MIRRLPQPHDGQTTRRAPPPAFPAPLLRLQLVPLTTQPCGNPECTSLGPPRYRSRGHPGHVLPGRLRRSRSAGERTASLHMHVRSTYAARAVLLLRAHGEELDVKHEVSVEVSEGGVVEDKVEGALAAELNRLRAAAVAVELEVRTDKLVGEALLAVASVPERLDGPRHLDAADAPGAHPPHRLVKRANRLQQHPRVLWGLRQGVRVPRVVPAAPRGRGSGGHERHCRRRATRGCGGGRCEDGSRIQ